MPPARRARSIPLDIDALRPRVEQGKLVRVGIVASGQFPDGVVGRIRRIGDPAIDGEEFIYVEVPVGGAKDVLPFAATDLKPAGATSRAPARSAPVGASPKAARPGSVGRTGGSPVGSVGHPAAGPTAAARPAGGGRAASTGPSTVPGTPGRAAGPSTTRDPVRVPGLGTVDAEPAGSLDRQESAGSLTSAAGSRPAGAEAPGGAARPTSSGGRGSAGAAARGRGRRSPVTITISTTGEHGDPWRIEARVGTRVAVRPAVVPPARVWEIVQTLGDDKLSATVEALLAEHRRAAQSRLDELSAEVRALRAELESLPPQ